MAAALFEQQGIVASTPMLHLLSALTQAGLFFKYLFLWLLPEPSLMSVDMREQFISSPEAWQSYLGLAAFIAYGVVAIRLLMRGGMKGLVGYAMLYPWLQFGVELVGIRVQEPFVLYRSYLWMPGVLLLIPLLLLKWPERRTYVLVGFVALLLIPLAWDRLWIFGDNYRLWNNAAVLLKNEHVPGADRIFYNRGQAEMSMQKWQNAVSDFERVVAINPRLEPVHYILGVAYTNAGRYQDALAQYDAAIAIKSDDDRVYYAKGMTLKKLHRDNEAMRQMEQSCKFKNAIACLISSGQMKPERHNEKK
jgi:tetratricopeptide (TPR) repeat protein